MRDLPANLTGERLAAEAYYDDYEFRFLNVTGGDSWKLERRQSFQEQGSPSWDAFARGERDEAIRLLEQRRQTLTEYYENAARQGCVLYRVRVVVEPISFYLQWELNSLRQRSECGEKIRIVDAADIVELERGGELPEILTVGSDVVYQVLYNPDGVLEGVIRSLRPSDVSVWRECIAGLYAVGEDMASYFDRNSAVLQPPRVR